MMKEVLELCKSKGTVVVTDKQGKIKKYLEKQGLKVSEYTLDESVPERIASVVKFEGRENDALVLSYEDFKNNDIRNIERIVVCLTEEWDQRVLSGKITAENKQIFSVFS